MTSLVLHGHTYQPPRENPFTGVLGVEPTAAPFHNWNERITAESYRPMAWARVTDEQNRVVDIVNLFEHMSFDFGPTLAAWLAVHEPAVHARIVDGDRRGRTAIAHPYHHTIFPLADRRDRQTELMWGLADFRSRFSRDATGVWLPEAAVDEASLDSVRQAGLRFVPLMADQVDGAESGCVVRQRGVDLVLADSGYSRELAFGVFSGSSHHVAGRGSDLVTSNGLAFAMTDTETFGHHHKFTERTLAYALTVLVPQQGLRTGSLESFLASDPIRVEGTLRTSSWSCAHGIGRWWRDCGCHNGDLGGQQGWRMPLRAALDEVRRHSRRVFAEFGAAHFQNPWLARDEYGSVLADPSSTDGFLARHLRAGAHAPTALALLESQRHALAMYTSCAWFFDDIGRLEAVLVLRHAARCLQLLAGFGAPLNTDHLLATLATAVSNDPAVGTGADIWRTSVVPAAHQAIDADALTSAPTEEHAAVSATALAISTLADHDLVAAADRFVTADYEARERVQELLFDAITAAPAAAAALRPLADQAGLAVDVIVERSVVGSSTR